MGRHRGTKLGKTWERKNPKFEGRSNGIESSLLGKKVSFANRKLPMRRGMGGVPEGKKRGSARLRGGKGGPGGSGPPSGGGGSSQKQWRKVTLNAPQPRGSKGVWWIARRKRLSSELETSFKKVLKEGKQNTKFAL